MPNVISNSHCVSENIFSRKEKNTANKTILSLQELNYVHRIDFNFKATILLYILIGERGFFSKCSIT